MAFGLSLGLFGCGFDCRCGCLVVGCLVCCGDFVFSCLSLGLFGCGFDCRWLVGWFVVEIWCFLVCRWGCLVVVSIVVGLLVGLLWRFGVFSFVVGTVWLWFRSLLVGWLVCCGD